MSELGAEAARVTLVHLVQMRSDRSWRMPVEAVMLLQIDDTLCSNTLIVRRTLLPAHRARSVIAAGSQHLSRSRPCCLTKITLSESWSMLQWVWFSAWAGLSLLDSFSKNVRIKSAPNQRVSFWIKPLVLGSQKSVSKETYPTGTQQIWNREGDAYFSFFMKEKLLFLIWSR